MKERIFIILSVVCGNLYAESGLDTLSYQDILKYREMIYKIPEDKFLKNSIMSAYSISPEINKNLTVRPSDIILKDDNTVTVWATQKIIDGSLNTYKIKAGDLFKQQYRIDCYSYKYTLLNSIIYRKGSSISNINLPKTDYIDIPPQTAIATVATRACLFQAILERRKLLTE